MAGFNSLILRDFTKTQCLSLTVRGRQEKERHENNNITGKLTTSFKKMGKVDYLKELNR